LEARFVYLCAEPSLQKKAPEILVVGSGKGGVGKSCLAVNAAVTAARKGWRVILVDADLGCSNVETILGTRSERRLDEFFHQTGRKELRTLLCDTHYENLRLIPGATGLLDVANPKFAQKQAFLRELRRLDADLIIVDLEAGTHLNALDIFLITETNGVLVITPEKTSIDNAFKFLRAALFRRIERFYQSPEVAVLLKRNETLDDFIGCIRRSDAFDEVTTNRVCGEIMALARSIRPKVVVNKAHNAYEAQIAMNILVKYTRQHLCIEPTNLGFMFFDKCVPDAVNSGTPFVVSHPHLKISGCVADIINRLGYV
jgi:flagellar biosynthesis protein FlhG